ncbi:hypothetical protein [Ottowia caeni]|uniref:hypothetical protein n=1 Tax=Ottowia caeni TaxID=2870339 RepID=UPI001E65B039|nr:hypothetical protein [Ottowia caeni]
MRRFFLGLLAVLLSLGVASCGGGGGYDGETGPNNSLRMSPLLSDVGLSVGYIAKVARITQGVEPYYVLSSDPSVSAQLLEDGTLVVRGNAPGTSTVSVQDSSVSQKSISLTVQVTAKALSTSVGTALTLAANESRTFTVTGGMAPYTVSSSNNSIVAVTSQMGGVITVTGRSNGVATLRITDDIGATLEVTVTVNAPAFSVSPETATGQVGTEMVFSILGGVGPYTAISSAPAVATVQVAGDIARVQLRTEGESTLTFRDAMGQSVSVTVTSTQTLPPLSLAPTSGSGQVGTGLVFTAIGGAGPFTARSSNPSIASVSVSGSTINVSLLAVGSASIIVLDSKGQSATATVTATGGAAQALTASPTAASDEVGRTVVFTVAGGSGPYTAVSSSPSRATTSVNGSLVSVNLINLGASTITIRDAQGQSVSVSVTGVAPSAGGGVLPISPLNQTVLHTSTAGVNYSLGGFGPYVPLLSASDTDVASASVSGNTLTIGVGNNGAGTRCILPGTTRDIQVTVVDNSTGATGIATQTIAGVGSCP